MTYAEAADNAAVFAATVAALAGVDASDVEVAVVEVDGAIVVEYSVTAASVAGADDLAATLEAAGFETRPYHAYVPSFGEWGFILASPMGVPEQSDLLPGGRFVTTASEPLLFQFPPDMARVDAEPNRLDNQRLVRTFANEWRRYDG